MQTGGFGRKGLEAGAQLPQRGPFPAQRKTAPDAELAAKRAAFIAAERARTPGAEITVDQPELSNEQSEKVLRQTNHGPVGTKKSMLLAYICWYFAGPISAHRFYLGDTDMAIKQCGGFVGGLLLLFLGAILQISFVSSAGVVVMLGAFLWVLADIFFIPGLCRKANAPLLAPGRIFD